MIGCSGFYTQATRWLAILLICIPGLTACNGSSSNTQADNDSDTPPTTPGDLTAAVYTSQAAELFWTASTDDGGISGYDIVRNDVLIESQLDAYSYFDTELEPATTYHYRVFAVDDEGNRSLAAETALTTRLSHDAGLDVIRIDNVSTLVAAVFDAYRGVPWSDSAYALPGFSDTPELTPNETRTIICENGGTATLRGSTTGYGGYEYQFDNCQDGATLFDGQVDNYADRYSILNIRGPGITVAGATDTIRFAGHVRKIQGGDHLWIEEPVNVQNIATDGTFYAFTGATTEFRYGVPPRSPWEVISLSGSFALTSDRTEGATVRVETPETLGRPTGYDPQSDQVTDVPEDWAFTYGSLRVTAPDGSGVLLDADNGDETSVRLTLTDSAGATATFDQPWYIWQENLRFD